MDIWERKYEVDSLCAPLELTWVYCEASGDYSVLTENWVQMARRIVSVFRTEQDHSRSPYWFRRKNCPAHDTLPGNGHGTPVKVTGMTWSGFRPSDDSCIYGYLIPSNMMAVCALQHMQILLGHISGQESLAKEAGTLAQEIRKGIEEYGVTEKAGYGKIYAYETDGLGHWNLMDDANVPNLLSIPYLGYAKVDDPLYQNTRRFLLSKDNPYYFSGRYGSGEGSPHTLKNYIWPIGVVMQAMTSGDSNEILNCLSILTHTDAGTGFMHESFDVEDPRHFSRDWFAWANTLFAELLEDLMESHFFEKRKL